VQKKLQEASNSIEDVAVRRRQIGRKLASVETLTEVEARLLLPLGGTAETPPLDD
jgi:DNA recombination protein RmuC